MKWLITRDHIQTDCAFNRGTVSGSEAQAAFMNSAPWLFRLYDDDGNLYYEGAASHADFDPLDWAENHAGATVMKVSKRGSSQWETL